MSTYKDKSGQVYQAPRPAPADTKVIINTGSGPKPGTMTGGGYVVPTKTK